MLTLAMQGAWLTIVYQCDLQTISSISDGNTVSDLSCNGLSHVYGFTTDSLDGSSVADRISSVWLTVADLSYVPLVSVTARETLARAPWSLVPLDDGKSHMSSSSVTVLAAVVGCVGVAVLAAVGVAVVKRWRHTRHKLDSVVPAPRHPSTSVIVVKSIVKK